MSIYTIYIEKTNGKMKELATIGMAQNQDELGVLLSKGREWISKEQERRHLCLNLFGEKRSECESELLDAEQMLSCITNISINGADLILDRVFDNVGFNRIEDVVF